MNDKFFEQSQMESPQHLQASDRVNAPRFRGAMAGLALLGVGAVGGYLFGNQASEVQVEQQADVTPMVGQSYEGEFSATEAYDQSEAVLRDTPFELQAPLSQAESDKMEELEREIFTVIGGKGGLTSAEQLKQMVPSLTGEEAEFFVENVSNRGDRSMQERNEVNAAIEANNASFIGAVEVSSGIRFNFYQAHLDDTPDELQIDPKALDAMTQFMFDKFNDMDYQSVVPQAEMDRLLTLASEGKLDGITISVLVADNISDCVFDNVLRPPMAGEACEALGVEIDRGDLQAQRTSDYRNTFLLIGRYPDDQQLEQDEQLDHGVPAGPPFDPPVRDVAQLNETLGHEYIHALISFTGLTQFQRTAGSPVDIPWHSEHSQIVDPPIYQMKNQLLVPETARPFEVLSAN